MKLGLHDKYVRPLSIFFITFPLSLSSDRRVLLYSFLPSPHTAVYVRFSQEPIFSCLTKQNGWLLAIDLHHRRLIGRASVCLANYRLVCDANVLPSVSSRQISLLWISFVKNLLTLWIICWPRRRDFPRREKNFIEKNSSYSERYTIVHLTR